MSSLAIAFPAPAANFCLVLDRGVGPDARALRDAVDEALSFGPSLFYREAAQPQKDTLHAVGETVLSEHAIAVDPKTLDQAFALVLALPHAMPEPEVTLEADGQIGFDWNVDRDRVVSLNVGPTGMIGYASLIGLESSYGRVPFAGTLPKRILDLLQRVAEKR